MVAAGFPDRDSQNDSVLILVTRERVFRIDVRTPLSAAPDSGHNRWHPDIAPLAVVAPGETIVVDSRDGLDGQVIAGTSPDALRSLDMRRCHPMTGPFFIDGAQPGDLLEVEMLEITPGHFGWTIIVPGLGLLGEQFDDYFVARWTIEGTHARSEDLPGVKIRGEPFLGVVGVAPSHERLRAFGAREAELARHHAGVPLPDVKHAVPSAGAAASEGLRTAPPRETGGNLDIKQLTRGSRLILPVDVPGALLSVGDPHFAQGDGESCGVAIEVHARARFRVGLCRENDVTWRPRFPALEFVDPPRTTSRRYFVTTGLPVDSNGRNGFLDLNLAARSALEEMVTYLTTVRGYTSKQAYVLTSVAVDLRISEAVDAPNALVSAILPLDIFDEP